VQGNITADKVEIRKTGRVWGDVVTAAFATEEGAFLRGQVRMEEQVDLGLGSTPTPEPARLTHFPIIERWIARRRLHIYFWFLLPVSGGVFAG
jgi:hypothetical protein